MRFPVISQPPSIIPSASPNNKDESITGKFDPTALERGAKALKELDVSPNAEKAFEITKLQEVTKQKELQRDIEQTALARSHSQTERTKVDSEEKRKNINHQQEQERITAQYKAQLEGEAYQKKLQDQQRQNEEWLAQQHQQFLRQEEIKRRNDQQAMEEKKNMMREEKAQERETLKIKVQEETIGKIKQERENIDVHLRSLRAKAAEERKTKLESIESIFSGVGAGCKSLLSDKAKMSLLVGGITATALGVYGARMATRLFGTFIEQRLGKPSLIRETSRWTYHNSFRLTSPMAWLRRPRVQWEDKLVLHADLKERLGWTTSSMRSAQKNGSPQRHMCLFGPPGTGKTLFAKTLAKNCEMDYAIMTGGDVGPLGAQATSELNKLFEWGKKSRRGLILFIDEADAFLRKGRSSITSQISEDTRNALSSFLYHTGSESEKLCIVLATNCPEVLDSAVLDRIDDQCEFPLPGLEERLKMLNMFFQKYVTTPTKKHAAIKVDPSIDDAFFRDLAKRTNNFSGRQLAKLCIALQASVFGSGGNILTKGLAEVVTKYKLDQHALNQDL